jgi:hypothetical protein
MTTFDYTRLHQSLVNCITDYTGLQQLHIFNIMTTLYIIDFHLHNSNVVSVVNVVNKNSPIYKNIFYL